MSKNFRIAAFALIPLILVAYGAIWWQQRHGADEAATSAPFGGPFTLVDHTGSQVTHESYPGKFILMFFGYTFCPDVCPTELGNLAVALDELGGDIEHIVPMFISVDVERDTPELLAEYVSLFHDSLIGLTGTRDQVDEVAWRKALPKQNATPRRRI